MDNESKEYRESVQHYIKIIFESPDDNNTKKTIIYPFGDIYNDKISYKENVEYLANIIYDDGGFWLDKETIIPYHRICSFGCHVPIKPQINSPDRVKQRWPRRDNRRDNRRENIPNNQGKNIEAKNI